MATRRTPVTIGSDSKRLTLKKVLGPIPVQVLGEVVVVVLAEVTDKRIDQSEVHERVVDHTIASKWQHIITAVHVNK